MASEMKKKISYFLQSYNCFNKNNQFICNNSIYENHKCGDHGYRCEDYYFKVRIWSIEHIEEDS